MVSVTKGRSVECPSLKRHSTLLHPHKSRTRPSLAGVIPSCPEILRPSVGSRKSALFQTITTVNAEPLPTLAALRPERCPAFGIFHCRHCQFCRGQRHGKFVSIGPLGEVNAPQESLATARASCPTFASDSLPQDFMESNRFSSMPPLRAIRVFRLLGTRMALLAERSHPSQNRSLTARSKPSLSFVSPRKFSGRYPFRGLCGPLTKATSPRLEVPTSKSQNRWSLIKKLSEPRATHLHMRPFFCRTTRP